MQVLNCLFIRKENLLKYFLIDCGDLALIRQRFFVSFFFLFRFFFCFVFFVSFFFFFSANIMKDRFENIDMDDILCFLR